MSLWLQRLRLCLLHPLFGGAAARGLFRAASQRVAADCCWLHCCRKVVYVHFSMTTIVTLHGQGTISWTTLASIVKCGR
jgi:hypothetical protein